MLRPALGWLRDRRWLALVVVAAATLWAGLYPFSFWRPNSAAWRPEGGLAFAPGSMAISPDAFVWGRSFGPAQLGIELWLTPRSTAAEERDILAIVDHPVMPKLRVLQVGSDLVVASRVRNSDGERWYNDFRFPGVMAGTHPRHLVLLSGTPRPRLLVDGEAVHPTSGFGIPLGRPGRLGGHLLLGSDAEATRSWEGILRGLVVHDGEPAWARSGAPVAARPPPSASGPKEPTAAAAYAFDEGSGRTAHDLAGGGRHLELPEYYRPRGARALRTDGPSAFASVRLLVDALVNLFGFVPFGVVLALVVAGSARRRATVVVLVTASGLATSLAIECLQTLLPTRDSSLPDLVLNTVGATLGAVVGAWLAGSRPARSERRDTTPTA